MCGRIVMELTPELLATVFGIPKVPLLVPSYNIAPTQLVLVVRQGRGEGQLLRERITLCEEGWYGRSTAG